MKLRYFASIRECIGKSEEIFNLDPTIETVADLIEELKKSGDEYLLAFELSSLKIAVDHTHAHLSTNIKTAKEIAFFPPMTGG